MGKKIALLLGVSEYKNESDLPPCQRDIDLISTVVSGSEKYDDILVLGESPKSVEAKDKISAFIRKNQAQDIDEVFVYYTGHGARHGDDFLYLFADFDNNKIEQTSLRNSEFDSMLKSLKPELTIKVVDACQAGTEYIKSNNDLQVIFEKSSSESFSKTYFLFSSSSSESSTALRDYSVFTKSLALSLLDFEGQDIRYRDVMAYISDDHHVKRHQTPLFIQQADNTEIFCSVSTDLAENLRAKLAPSPSSSSSGSKSDAGSSEDALTETETSEEERLIASIRLKSKKYCSEEEAQISLKKLIESLSSYSWSTLITELYNSEVNVNDYVQPLGSIKSIAKWIKESDEQYFARLTHDEEEYQAKEKIEIEEAQPRAFTAVFGRQKRIEYQPVTKYRKVLSGYDLTAPAPGKSVTINLSPNEEVLPWLKVFFTFVFSKSKLTIFYKHEVEKETSWNNRVLEENNQWKTSHCELKNVGSIEETVNDAFANLEKSIAEIIASGVEAD